MDIDDPTRVLLGQKIDSEEKLLEIIQQLTDSGTMPLQHSCEGLTPFADQREHLREDAGYFNFIWADIVRGACTEDPQQLEFDRYLHPTKCGTMVAYASTTDKHNADVWSTMKLGRYLTKYHPEISNEAIKKIVLDFEYKYGVPPTVKFGETAADFVRAIQLGPKESCMSDNFYSGGCFPFRGAQHPACIYAAGDIEVAWIESGNRVTARALCNKETKAFSRVYGDKFKLIPQLVDRGYTQINGALLGCRLLRIEDDHGHIMCYVDAGVESGGGSLSVSVSDDDDGFWILVDGGDRSAHTSTYVGYSNNGVTDEGDEGDEDDDHEYYSCADCGGGVCDEYDLTSTYSGSEVCNTCLDDCYRDAITNARNSTTAYVHEDHVTYIGCRDEWVATCILDEFNVVFDVQRGEYIEGEDATECVCSGRLHHVDDMTSCGTMRELSIYINYAKRRYAVEQGQLYVDIDGDIFWHESDEVEAWLAEADEVRDPEKYILEIIYTTAITEEVT